MKPLTALSAVVMCAITVLAATEPVGAATSGSVSIRTIATQTAAYGSTVRIRPTVVVGSRVRTESTLITVRRGTTYVARNLRSAALPAGSFRITVHVRYRIRSGGRSGSIRHTQRSQDLRILSRPDPAELVVPPPSSPCGSVSPIKKDGSPWHCTFSDEFAGTTLDARKWRVQQTALDGVHTGPECWVDSPDNIAVAGGALRLTTRKEPEPFTCNKPGAPYVTSYTGASVNTWQLFSQTYGRFEFRASFPDVKVAGTHGALWLYPESTARYGQDHSTSGEIDVAEVYSVYPDRAIPYIHYQTASADTVTAWNCMLDPATFHTYTAEWTPISVRILYDGKLCREHVWNPLAPLTGSAPFDQPFIAVMTQTLGVAGTTNAFVPGSTPLPATMRVDYVRIWS